MRTYADSPLPERSRADILDEIDDTLADWRGSDDSATWAADGSHQDDPGDLECWRPIGIIQRLDLRAAAADAHERWGRMRCRRHECKPVAPDPDVPPDDPRERALWLRRRRGTGPAGARLDGRRR